MQNFVSVSEKPSSCSADFICTKDLAQMSRAQDRIPFQCVVTCTFKDRFQSNKCNFGLFCVRQNIKIMTGNSFVSNSTSTDYRGSVWLTTEARKRKGNKQQLWGLLVLNQKTHLFTFTQELRQTITTESEKLTDGCTTTKQKVPFLLSLELIQLQFAPQDTYSYCELSLGCLPSAFAQ